MSLKEFRNSLLDQMLDLLWDQWSALGVLGRAGAQDNRVIDPESLLVFSLEVARYDARLFDEVLDWVLVNGNRLDTARLRRFITDLEKKCTAKSDYSTVACANLRVLGSVMQYLSAHGDARKWGKLAGLCRDTVEKLPSTNQREVLFIDKTGKEYPISDSNLDPAFRDFSLLRQEVERTKKSMEVPVTTMTNLRFLLRSLFGVGARAESVLYLLTHDSGHPRKIAEASGFFWLSIQQVLSDMSRSRLIQTRATGKRIEYRLSHDRWWQFISYSQPNENQIPKWLNWSSIFYALSHFWHTLDTAANQQNLSDYMISSKLQDGIEVLNTEFSKAGLDVPPPPAAGLSPNAYENSARQFLNLIFKNKEVSSTK